MPDVRLKLDPKTHRVWRHLVIDIEGNSEEVFIKVIDFYIKNKGKQII